MYRVPGPAQDWKPAEPVKVADFPEPAGPIPSDAVFKVEQPTALAEVNRHTPLFTLAATLIGSYCPLMPRAG